ncbi:MAG: FAD-dependent monooxygenase [Pseudomonadales bacterium]
MADQDVLVVGGGIGGVSAALCFARCGINVHVFEQAAEFGAVGAGIQLTPNATRVLHDLGLEVPLREVAFLPEAVEMREWNSGRMLASNLLGAGLIADYGFPYYHVHRADLMRVLVNAAQDHPGIRLHSSAEVQSIERHDPAVSLNVAGTHYQGALLIGADGIHSMVRTELFGLDAPRFTGNVAWRGLVPADRLPTDLVHPVASVWLGPHKHFVHYYVGGGALVNCVCVIEKDGWEVESWNERGDHAELKADFSGWHETVEALIDNMDPHECFKWALFDRAPMSHWSRGRVTLLGDACHPTLPFMAQGAAMAIEDGAVLSRCVAQGDDIASSLLRYESLRRPRTARIQGRSRRNAKVFHLSGIKAWVRNRAVGRAGSQMMNWLYRYNALDASG